VILCWVCLGLGHVFDLTNLHTTSISDANFITQVFVITLAYLHYGPIKTFVDYPTNAAMSNMILERGKVCKSHKVVNSNPFWS
jgi:hypothetical protein